ncbi:MAG: VWA domain-containing protein [Armatimonadetes bacterium]|nr:VWA domain-containing protein [Armatimonadota bacterium]
MKKNRLVLSRWRGFALLAVITSLALPQMVAAGNMPWFQTTTRRQPEVSRQKDGWHTTAYYAGQSKSGATLIDLVISLHNRPSGDNDVTTNDDRTPYEQIIQYFADGVYEMSNGAHKLRKVRIYTSGFYADKCDITWSASGWPCANACGRGIAGKHVYMFTNFSGTDFLTNQELGGYCLAHEWGHYFYGMYDEYKASNTSYDSYEQMPNSTDDPSNVSIMNNQWKGNTDKNWLNFSTDTRSDYTKNNAQFRVYKAACWQTLARNSTDDPKDGFRNSLPSRPYYSELSNVAPVAKSGASVPSSIELPSTEARSDLEIIWMDNTIVYQIVIDRSGSMDEDDKMENAKTAAKLLVDAAPLPDKPTDPAIAKIGVIDFDDSVTVTYPITEIRTQADKNAIKEAIDTLYPRGWTAIFDAALTALSGLNAEAANTAKITFLLSDGYNNVNDDLYDTVISSYRAAQVPIFSFGYGSSVDPRLASLASETGGRYYSSPTSLKFITSVFQDAMQAATTTTGIATGSTTLPAGQLASTPIYVDPSLKDLNVVVTFVGAPGDLTAELKDPSGVVVSPAETTQSGSETLIRWTVPTPATGSWTLSGTPTSGPVDVTFRATATPDDETTYTVALASLTGSTVTYPEPIVLLATLEKGLPICGAVVEGRVRAPNGDITDITLRDDGVPPDAIANDGSYSAILDYTLNGVYEIEVSMNNNAGLAHYTYAGVQMAIDRNGNSGDVPPAPVGENFMRFARIQITTTGVNTDDHGNTPDTATAIQPNNDDHPGKIDSAGDVDVFSFVCSASPTIIRVTDFALGMDPRLRIVGPDKSSVLVEGDLSNADTANGYLAVSVAGHIGSTLYAEVSHKDPVLARGTYNLSVGSSIPGDFAIRFTNPGVSWMISTSSTIDIAGVASAGCQKVTWSNDRGGHGTCSGTTSWSKTSINLEPGTNLITATATSSTGEKASATLTVVYWTGLVMVSVPLIPNQSDPGNAIDFSSWMRYDPLQGNYIVYGSPDDSAHFTWFQPAADVPGKGYWGYWQSPGTKLPSGMALNQTEGGSIKLKAGWNMIGNPFLSPLQWRLANILVKKGSTTKTLAEAKDTGWCADYLWGWKQSSSNPTTGEYVLVYDTGLVPGVEGWIKPWAGYWFKANVDCELILPPPPVR